MTITNVDMKGIRRIARKLGIMLIEQKNERLKVKIRIWPKVGKQIYRAIGKAGKPRLSLCWHMQYAFMSEVFAAYPDASIKTWVAVWNYVLFQSGAKVWTFNEISDRAKSETCDCTPEMIEETMRDPDTLRRLAKSRVAITGG
jgi:hypothetical protein